MKTCMQKVCWGVSYGLTPEGREGSKIGQREKLNGDLVTTILSRAYKELQNYLGFKKRGQIFIPFPFPPHRPVNEYELLLQRRHVLVWRNCRESRPTESHQSHTYSASAADGKSASVLKYMYIYIYCVYVYQHT